MAITLVCTAHAQSAGWVMIPVNEYRTLRQRAYPAERETPPPRVEAALTRVEYDLRIEGQLAAGRANLTVDVMNEGWVNVPLPAGLLRNSDTIFGFEVAPGFGARSRPSAIPCR